MLLGHFINNDQGPHYSEMEDRRNQLVQGHFVKEIFAPFGDQTRNLDFQGINN